MEGPHYLWRRQLLSGHHVGLDGFFVPAFFHGYGENLHATVADMEEALATAPWNDRNDPLMLFRSQPLPYDRCFLVEDPGPVDAAPPVIRVHRHTGWKWDMLRRCRAFESIPAVQLLAEDVQSNLTIGLPHGYEREVCINHATGTLCAADDYVGFHSDKTTDVRSGTPTLIFSFGEAREIHFRRREEEYVCGSLILDAGSLLILGPKTNAALEHSLVPISDELLIERDTEEAEEHYSLEFRDVFRTIRREDIETKILQDDTLRPMHKTGWDN